MKERDYIKQSRSEAFRCGIKDAVPIGLGYLAVSFSLGIVAKNAGITAGQGFIASLLCLASAGEYAGFSLIAVKASLAEMALVTFIINMRYMLMSLALAQKVHPEMPFRHRLLFGYSITDEVFAINIARPGWLDPWYFYGAIAMSAPLWALGTSLGIFAGNILPARTVSALSVALYGMFIAIIMPQAKKDKVVAALIPICFAASWGISKIGFFAQRGEGTRTIILTVLISAAAALLFPIKEEQDAR